MNGQWNWKYVWNETAKLVENSVCCSDQAVDGRVDLGDRTDLHTLHGAGESLVFSLRQALLLLLLLLLLSYSAQLQHDEDSDTFGACWLTLAFP